MMTNNISSASLSATAYTATNATPPVSQIHMDSDRSTADASQTSTRNSNSPSHQLQQFVTVLFQSLEQNQEYIQQQRAKDLAKMQEELAQQTRPQNPYASDKPPLVQDLESLVSRLSDDSSNNDKQGATPQLQQFYQETPLRSAYPNLPLGSMLQQLQQSLDSNNPDSLPHQGTLLDTQA